MFEDVQRHLVEGTPAVDAGKSQHFDWSQHRQPVMTAQFTAVGVTSMLEAVRITKPEPGKPRRDARLELRRRRRAGDVADGPAGPGRRLRRGGVSRTVRELVQAAFAVVGLDVDVDVDEHVVVDPDFVRPPDPVPLVGDPSKARSLLGWKPRTGFEEMIEAMVEALRGLGGA